MDSTMAEPDLAFLAQQIERLISNDARQRDDMAVLTAIVMRLDGTVTALLQECGHCILRSRA